MCAARSSIHGAVPDRPEIGEGDRSGRGWGPGVVEVGEGSKSQCHPNTGRMLVFERRPGSRLGCKIARG